MTLPRSGSKVKYELLEENERSAIKASQIWLAVLLVILMICSSIIAFFLTWKHILGTPKEEDNLDFLMVGPTKILPGYSWMSQHRGEMYGLASMEMSLDQNETIPELDLTISRHSEPQEYKRVCYYGLPNNGSFDNLRPDMVPPHLCTHILVAFATVENGRLQPNLLSDLESYKNLTALKEINPKLKVMLSVQWFTSAGEFAWIVSAPENRTLFVESSVKFLTDNKFDGLDIDWEFPSWPTVVENQTSYFADLLRLMSSRFRQQEPPLLLSVAVGAPKPIIDQSYNTSAMADYIDFVNVMAYDYHMYQSLTPLTGPNAPLYEREKEMGYFGTLNLNWTASYWLLKGMPAWKIIMGIPTYGHSFTLVNEANHGWDAPSSGFGSIGEQGFASYSDVCSFVSSGGVQSMFDFESKVPYAFKGKEWISFDNEQSVAYKAEFVKQHQFGGVMIFSLNTDDVLSLCDGKTRFPLTERVRNVLQDDQL